MMERTLPLAIGIALLFIFTGIELEPSVSNIGWMEPAVVAAEEQVADIGMKVAGIVREVTAYNVGVRSQTSRNPCIGAGGHNLCQLVKQGVKVCAANFVPLSTVLHIEGYGDYIVLDRMNRRYMDRIDIAMNKEEIEEARDFGLQKRIVEARD